MSSISSIDTSIYSGLLENMSATTGRNAPEAATVPTYSTSDVESSQVDLNNHSLTGQLTGRSNGLDLTINLAGQWQSPIAVLDTEQIRKANNLVAKPQPKEEKKPSGWDKLKDFFRNRF